MRPSSKWVDFEEVQNRLIHPGDEQCTMWANLDEGRNWLIRPDNKWRSSVAHHGPSCFLICFGLRCGTQTRCARLSTYMY